MMTKIEIPEVRVVDDGLLNTIALFALHSGLDPFNEKKIRKCKCDGCSNASLILDLVGQRMRDIVNADGARKS